MQSQRHHRLIALSLGLLALSGGCISSVSAETQQMASDEAAAATKIDSQKNKVKIPDRRRRRLGAKAMKLMGQQVTNEQQQHHQMQENDSNVIDEADEEFWARMLQQVGGSIPNQPPVANDVTATTRDDATVSGNVLANDSDPDGDDIAVVRADGKPVRRETTLTLGSGAILAINNKGDYTYDPNGQYDFLQNGETATDSFTYTIADTSGATDSAVVTITITASASTKPPTPAPTKAPTKAPTPVLVPPTPVPPTPGKSTIHSQQKIFMFFFFHSSRRIFSSCILFFTFWHRSSHSAPDASSTHTGTAYAPTHTKSHTSTDPRSDAGAHSSPNHGVSYHHTYVQSHTAM